MIHSNGHVHRYIVIRKDQLVLNDGIVWDRIIDRRHRRSNIEVRLYTNESGRGVEISNAKPTLIAVDHRDLVEMQR